MKQAKRSLRSTPVPAWLLPKLPDSWYLAKLVAVGAIVRFIGIAHSSVWHDEGYTLLMSPLPPGEILRRTALDVHPPLYYLVLHVWLQLFGTSETAARSLSLVFMLGVIVFSFLTLRRLFDSSTARLGGLFVTLAPFLVRYSQEARMYGMLAFIASLATYYLVRAWESDKWSDWLVYGAVIAAGLYTYYYVIFLVAFHWCYVAYTATTPKLSWESVKTQLLHWRWIVANALAVGLFAPWLPTAYKQFTSIQGAYWIPAVTGDSIPSTIAQFLTYTDMGAFNVAGRASRFIPSLGLRSLFLVTMAGLLAAYLWRERRNYNQRNVLFVLYAALTPLAVFVLSLRRPVYVDRYFVFSAVAFYILLAILILRAWPLKGRSKSQAIVSMVFVGVFIIGISNVYRQGTHQMRALSEGIQAAYTPGDAIINADFYTYFDYHYYNHTGSISQAYVPANFSGCCEGKSMLYDHPESVVKNLADVHPSSHYVWMVGKTGEALPATWTQAGATLQYGSQNATRYHVE
jgi:mannosyltransferase